MKRKSTRIEMGFASLIQRGFVYAAYVVAVAVMGFGGASCGHQVGGGELSNDQRSNNEMKIGATNIYGEPPSGDYIIIEGANSIVIEAKHRGVTDDLRVYVLWEPELTVGNVFEGIGRNDGLFYLIRLIRDDEVIYSGAGGLRRHMKRDWELNPGDLIELNEEIF